MEKNFIAMQDLIPTKNDTPYKRILAIGDVHASFEKLISLWEKISVTDKDFVIFLGDYFEGGNKNFKTLSWLMEKNLNENIKMLLGNIDEAFLGYFASLRPTTIEEAAFIKQIQDFIKNLPLYHKIKIGGRDYIFCHAGINPEKPLEKQDKDEFIWEQENFYASYNGDAVFIVGHKSPRKIMNYFLPQFSELDTLQPVRITHKNILLLDTRAKDFNGYLSCVDILTGEFWQS
ncbi:MAG: metallophosphoesterase [Selenomonadaceae bacterium]|nr:metallophosphoesterase [Selenomonadaceae bacterium]